MKHLGSLSQLFLLTVLALHFFRPEIKAASPKIDLHKTIVNEEYPKDSIRNHINQRDTVLLLSNEAMAILNRPLAPLPFYYTAKDTTIFTPLFTPLVFDLEHLYFKGFNQDSITDMIQLKGQHNPFKKGVRLQEFMHTYTQDNIINKGLLHALETEWKVIKTTRDSTFRQRMDIVQTTTAMLPKDRIEYNEIAGKQYDGRFEINKKPEIPVKNEKFNTVQIEKIYWIPHFESSIQFSQNQVSDNWYRGGNNSFNLNMRNYFSLTFNKGRMHWVNEIESKLGFFNASNKLKNKYKISEDFFRVSTNFGIKAFQNWYYTVNGEFRSQLLVNRNDKDKVITRPFSPYIINGGPGMKYEVRKTWEDNKFKVMRFSANISPLSVNVVGTFSDKIDTKRVGLDQGQRYKVKLGSTIRAKLDFDFSQTINWQSRLYYNTSFKNIETDWENTLNFAISRYFSTRINLHLRFDDSVITDDNSFKNLIQYNEILSFGFAYRL